MIDQIIDWSNDWLIKWLIDQMIDWSNDWWIKWLMDQMIDGSNDWMMVLLIDWLIDDGSNDWLIALIDWLQEHAWEPGVPVSRAPEDGPRLLRQDQVPDGPADYQGQCSRI